jgi:site-specific DNA recombinase
MNAVIYARCSTDEDHQDVDKQIKECQRYCQAYAWPCEVVQEYVSGFKDVKRPGFEAMLEAIRLKKYDALIVYDLSRFSRQEPYIANEELDRIVHRYGCRFISLADSIDSQDEIKWHIVRAIMVWQSHNYSKKLSESIKAGIRNKKDKGLYTGGRPKISLRINKYDVLKAYNLTGSYRKASALIWKEQQIKVSYASVQRIVRKNSL